jgi:hypothetical protein
MKPLDRALCLSAGLLGMLVFLFALRLASNPPEPQPGWELPIACGQPYACREGAPHAAIK